MYGKGLCDCRFYSKAALLNRGKNIHCCIKLWTWARPSTPRLKINKNTSPIYAFTGKSMGTPRISFKIANNPNMDLPQTNSSLELEILPHRMFVKRQPKGERKRSAVLNPTALSQFLMELGNMPRLIPNTHKKTPIYTYGQCLLGERERDFTSSNRSRQDLITLATSTITNNYQQWTRHWA